MPAMKHTMPNTATAHAHFLVPVSSGPSSTRISIPESVMHGTSQEGVTDSRKAPGTPYHVFVDH
ncbi:hypothetical protein E2C01_025786 [Portunus trituberculatus]|uniref:Uncharacterized protein n=1 Tax=Portunus trituberculatus TaxID=210409 RepID=A0A5B7EH24_PORTR|nr:hypothetical protein [Portunus trituberculatus]